MKAREKDDDEMDLHEDSECSRVDLTKVDAMDVDRNDSPLGLKGLAIEYIRSGRLEDARKLAFCQGICDMLEMGENLFGSFRLIFDLYSPFR